MRQHRRRSARIVLALAATALLFAAPRAGRGMPPVRPETRAIAPGAALQERAAVATTPHFAFYSDLATNLNDALIAAGDARRRGRAELFHSGDGEAAGAASIAATEQQCFDALPAAERAGWERAVDYYAEIVAPSGNFGNEQLLLRSELAGLPGQASDAEDRRLVEITGGFRTAASPAYEACRWAAQDAENRPWIDELLLRLAAHEETIASRLEHLYQTSWHGLPLTVDVVSTALPTGASSIFIRPAGGHILVSSLDDGNQGTAALEVVFHEGSHTIMRRSDPVQQALDEAAEALEVQAPRDLWHVVLFYTTGETVRRVLDESGEPGYAPYLYQGLFERAWPQLQRPIESTWPAYLNGERTLQEASRDLLRAIAGVDWLLSSGGRGLAVTNEGEPEARSAPVAVSCAGTTTRKRELRRLALRGAFGACEVEGDVDVITAESGAGFMVNMLSRAALAAGLPEEEVSAWTAEQQRKLADGTLLISMTHYLVTAIR